MRPQEWSVGLGLKYHQILFNRKSNNPWWMSISSPFMLRDVLRVVFILIVGHAIVSPGLSGFADGAIFLGKMLSRVDIFFVWNAILLVIGFGAAAVHLKARQGDDDRGLPTQPAPIIGGRGCCAQKPVCR